MNIGVMKLDYKATIPTRAHDDDLGFDLYALDDVMLYQNAVTKVNTGIAIQFPAGYGGLVRDRSSFVTRTGAFVVAGVIDPQYTGEVIIAFRNPTYDTIEIQSGQKIAQLILIQSVPCGIEVVASIDKTQRGSGGFGSTGQ